MTETQLKELGLDEATAKKVADASATELKDYIPKHRFDEVNNENKTLKSNAEENKKALEALKASSGDAEEMKKQIETMQEESKEAEKKYLKEMNEVRMENAIKLAIHGLAQDEDIVSGLFDKSKLILGDDGKVTGLEDQLETFKKDKPFLFKKEESNDNNKGGFQPKVGAEPPESSSGDGAKADLKSALSSYYQK